MMKTKNIIWAALSLTAALVMTACSNDDNMVDTPAAPQDEVKTIPYTVTVGQGGDAATTRATVESDMNTLYFATGDKLYITGTNIKGVLDIQTGTGTASATFSGDLTYSGSGTPASDLSLTATLVSAQQTVGTEVSVDAAGAVTVNYPTTAYCDDVATAVQKYSRLTGTSTYGEKSFTLSQQTAFLNFEITFEDGTATGTGLSAVVKNGETTLCTANRTTETVDEKVVAKFVLPAASGTTLSGATVKMGDKEALAITDATLTGKVYNVKKTYAAAPAYKLLSAATTSDYGKVVCAAGHLHTAKTAVPAGCTAVGILGKVTETGCGLILALKDAKSQDWNTFNGWTSVTTYAGTTLKVLPDADAHGSLTSYAALGTTAVSDWAVAQKSDYEAIFTNLGSTTGNSNGTTYDGNVNAYITTGVGGTALDGNYWSATEKDSGNALAFISSLWGLSEKTNSLSVRPVLGFGPAKLLSAATTSDVGKVVCADGHLRDAKTAVPAGGTAVGILGKVTETGHGLILALQDATSQKWNTINGWTSETTYAGTTLKVLPNDAARGANLTSYTTLGSTAVSNWAVAQKSDYEAIFTNLGSTTGNSNGKTYDANVNAYITTGVGGTALPDYYYYWSATAFDGDCAWNFRSDIWGGSLKTYSDAVRPVLGF